jgi:hypothetical protein
MAENGEKRDPSSHRTPGQITRQVNGYNRTPKQLKKRRDLAKANYDSQKAGDSSVGDGMDMYEKKPNRKSGTPTKKNTVLRKASANRADNGSRGSVSRRVRGK